MAIREHRWQELSNLSDRQRALLTVAEKLSAQPTRMVEEDWAPLRKAGLDDQGCLEDRITPTTSVSSQRWEGC